MINHFPSSEAAEAHLASKGFNRKGASNRWISPDGLVNAFIIHDRYRGVYVEFRA